MPTKLYNYQIDFSNGTTYGVHEHGSGTKSQVEAAILRQAPCAVFNYDVPVDNADVLFQAGGVSIGSITFWQNV